MVAAYCCCVPMSMPQGHLVALCTDLGILPSHGAAMLSVLLGTAFFSRQAWGWISDRIGGLMTVLIGSVWQFLAVVALTLTQDEIGLFTVSALFGLGFARHHPGLCADRARAVSGARGRLAHSAAAVLQRRRHGVGRLVRRPAVRSLRLLCAGLRGGTDLQRREPAADRRAGVAALAARADCGPRWRRIARMATRLGDLRSIAPDTIASATLTVETPGAGFTEITRDVAAFLRAGECGRRRAARLSAPHLGVAGDPGERRSGRADRSRHRARSSRAGECRLGARHRRAGRHAGAREGDAQRHLAACAGDRRQARARHLAGDLSRRAPRAAAPARGAASVRRQQAT